MHVCTNNDYYCVYRHENSPILFSRHITWDIWRERNNHCFVGKSGANALLLHNRRGKVRAEMKGSCLLIGPCRPSHISFGRPTQKRRRWPWRLSRRWGKRVPKRADDWAAAAAAIMIFFLSFSPLSFSTFPFPIFFPEYIQSFAERDISFSLPPFPPSFSPFQFSPACV